jgi:SPP1 gp7 family putative phage head morphogenesis protein
MVTPAPYTTGTITKAPRPSQADDRLLPPRRMMTAMEADAERRIGRALATMRRALLDGLTDDNAHLMLARLESEEVLRPFTDTIMGVLTDVSLAGAQWGAETVNRHAYGTKGVIDFVWDIVNEAAEHFARTYAYSLVTGITKETRKRLQGHISEFVRNQETINQLARRIKPLFGDVRAKMIAVTETTRAFAEGNQIAWKESGVIEQKRWVTANDELVCPVCGPLHQQVVDIDDEFEVTYATKRGLVTARFPHPPAHVSCRCGMTPVIVRVGDRVVTDSFQQPPAFATVKDAEEWMRQSGMFAGQVDIGLIEDPLVANRIAKTMSELYYHYGDQVKRHKFGGISVASPDKMGMAVADSTIGHIRLNSAYWKNADTYKKWAERTRNVYSASPHSALTHEMAHALDLATRTLEMDKAIEDLFETWVNTQNIDKIDISHYAMTSKEEMVAESFVFWHLNGGGEGASSLLRNRGLGILADIFSAWRLR